MIIFDAERYTISVRKEIVEGDELYVARVTELQDIEEYADTYAEARALAIDTIETAYELCLAKSIIFPEPAIIDDSLAQASGRITLRMPKTLHSQLTKIATDEGVSLNQYIVSAISVQYGQCKTSQNLMGELKNTMRGLTKDINDFHRTAATYMFKEYLQVANKQEGSWITA